MSWTALIGCAGLALFSTSCTSSSTSSASNRIVYLTAPDSNGVLVYRLDNSSGHLSAAVGSPYPTGNTPDAVYVAPAGNLLYVLDESDNNIGRYSIDPTVGSISEIPPRVSTGLTPVSMTMNSTGTCLFVANQNSYDLFVYAVDSSTGALTQAGQLTTVPKPSQILVSGNFLYVLNPALRSVLLYSFAIDSSGKCTGNLQLAGPRDGVIVGSEPKVIAIDPLGKFLYSADSANNEVNAFTLDPNTGQLGPVVGSPFFTDLVPVALAIDPASQYLYVANSQGNSISAFNINTDNGSLSGIDTGSYPVSSSPTSLSVDPSGKFLLVGSQGSKKLIAYFILDGSNNTTAGALGTSPVSTSLPDSPTSIVVRK